MENKEHLQNIDLRSEEVQEILSRPPNKILYTGYLIFAFALIAIIFSYQNFKSENVAYKMFIQTNRPSQTIISPSNTFVQDVYVGNKQHVTKGQKILMIDNKTIQSSVEGQVNFQNFISKNHLIKKEEQILTIEPEDQSIKKGSIFIDKDYRLSLQLNKVITFYIAESKSLTLKGTLHSVSDLPNNQGLYYAEVVLHNSTNDKKILSFVKDNVVMVQILR